MNKALVILMALIAAFVLGGCTVHEEHYHPRHRTVIVVPEHHDHGHHWR